MHTEITIKPEYRNMCIIIITTTTTRAGVQTTYSVHRYDDLVAVYIPRDRRTGTSLVS